MLPNWQIMILLKTKRAGRYKLSLKKPANFVPHFLGSLHATVTALARTCITIAWNAFPTARIPKIRPQSRVRKFAYRKAHFFIFFSGAGAALCRCRAAAILRLSGSHLCVFS